MYKKVKDLYLKGRLNESKVGNAVEKGWITEEERNEIIASKKDITE
ncbi:XkdX family protein [Clostridium sardiniense]|uniref:XkdX family protein n=2 Tax=Clostridium sardiniense TaxID=29369 RepID=A0ABS7KWR5_CLOSR|nr:XkdX family protein [Clostridium sardiniense]